MYFSFFLFYASYLLFYLFFCVLPSRIWTRSVSRPEVVGGNRTWVCFVLMFAVFLVKDACLFSSCRFSFYSAPQCEHCKRCTSYSNSICLSVCPSHAGIVSKRWHVARCSLHCWIAKCVQFCTNRKIFPRDDPFPLKFWLQVTYPLLKAASFDTFCLVAPQP